MFEAVESTNDETELVKDEILKSIFKMNGWFTVKSLWPSLTKGQQSRLIFDVYTGEYNPKTDEGSSLTYKDLSLIKITRLADLFVLSAGHPQNEREACGYLLNEMCSYLNETEVREVFSMLCTRYRVQGQQVLKSSESAEPTPEHPLNLPKAKKEVFNLWLC